MAAVALDALTKVFADGTLAVDGLTLDVEHGEFMVLLGPSGSGKTTVLRLVAGLEQPSQGHVYLDGHLVDQLTPRQRNVAMVFQDFALYPHLTVTENIAFPLRAAQADAATVAAQVIEAARRLGIQEVLDRLPHQLSGGEQQRVALARAAVRRPTVCLLDEPLTNVDAHSRLEMCAQIHDLNSAMGVTTVYVTHARSEALALADRVAVLRHGRLQQVGTPNQVYDDPATLFVASLLIRETNLVQGAVYHDGDAAVIDLGAQSIRMDGPDSALAALAAHHNERVTVAIRADALTPISPAPASPAPVTPAPASPAPVSPAPGGARRPVLRGVVRRVSDVGAEVIVEVDSGAVPIVPHSDDQGRRDHAGPADHQGRAGPFRRTGPVRPAGGDAGPPSGWRRAVSRFAGSVRPPTARTEYGFYPTYEPTEQSRDPAGDLVLRLPHDTAVRPRVGEPVALAVDLAGVYLFDRAGTRIRLNPHANR